MKRVAANEIGSILLDKYGAISHRGLVGVSPDGEPEFIGSAGDGDIIDSVLAYYGLKLAPSESSVWEYYKSALLNYPGSFMKAWLHWNGSGFDMYLKCDQSTDGRTGFASHAMPYIQW